MTGTASRNICGLGHVFAGMKAVAFNSPGGPDVLEVVELPDPTPGDGEILIRVQAVTVNPTDTVLRARQQPESGPVVPGMDVAGVIEAMDADADTDLQVGDNVMAFVVPSGSHGAYAERIVVPADSVARIPAGSTLVEAATLPMNGLTARLALDTLNLPAGATIAVTGSAGALGGYVIQLAKVFGLTVVADAAEADEELVKTLGADMVLPRGERFAEAVRDQYPDGVDGIVDAAVQADEVVPAAKDGATVLPSVATEANATGV